MRDPFLSELAARGISPLRHLVGVLETGGIEAFKDLVLLHPQLVDEAREALAPALALWASRNDRNLGDFYRVFGSLALGRPEEDD